MPRTPFADTRSRFLAGRFGLSLFLLSLGILFGSTLVGFLVMRLQIGMKHRWPDLPPLPRVLWLSTLAIVASSGTMQLALVSIRRDRAPNPGAPGLGTPRAMLQVGMLLTLALGLAFLALQSIAWLEWIVPVTERWHDSGEWRFALTCFYVFTGLHAAHVVGGLIPMSVVTLRALRGQYSADNHFGVQLCATYWHFLDVVWLALFATLLIGV